MAFDSLINDILNSDAMQRLQRVRHFGAFELEDWRPLVSMGGPLVSRYEHTLSVTRLTTEVVATNSFESFSKEYNILYALLHDIGHGPFSHSSENVFRHLAMDHHVAFERHVLSTERDSIGSILRDHLVDVGQFYNFSVKQNNLNLFHYPINPDLVDGLRLSSIVLAGTNPFEALDEVAALRSPTLNVKALDAIWRQKRRVYSDVISGARWKKYDLLFELALYRIFDRLSVDDFFLDDDEFIDKYGKDFRDVIFGKSRMSDLEQMLIEETAKKSKSRRIFVDSFVPLHKNENMRQRYIDSSV